MQPAALNNIKKDASADWSERLSFYDFRAAFTSHCRDLLRIGGR